VHKQKQRENENACRKCAKKSFVKTKKNKGMKKGR
jgi:DNA-directed RNA polymerase subunit RPC12/RpoP